MTSIPVQYAAAMLAAAAIAMLCLHHGALYIAAYLRKDIDILSLNQKIHLLHSVVEELQQETLPQIRPRTDDDTAGFSTAGFRLWLLSSASLQDTHESVVECQTLLKHFICSTRLSQILTWHAVKSQAYDVLTGASRHVIMVSALLGSLSTTGSSSSGGPDLQTTLQILRGFQEQEQNSLFITAQLHQLQRSISRLESNVSNNDDLESLVTIDQYSHSDN